MSHGGDSCVSRAVLRHDVSSAECRISPFERLGALYLLHLSFMMNRLMLRFDAVGTLDLYPLVLKHSGFTWPAVYIYE